MYEKHNLTVNYPVSFADYKLSEKENVAPHWHENIELIHITKGSMRAILDSKEVRASAGYTLIVNTNTIHQFFPLESELEYYCLIINVSLLKQLGLDFTVSQVEHCIYDDNISDFFSKICDVVGNKSQYYKSEMFAEAFKMAVLLLKNHTFVEAPDETIRNNQKAELVKKSISYMRDNYASHITLESISAELCVSKFYFCHIFKEMTGMTVIKMLNLIRCQEAEQILLNSEESVSQAARSCGFENLSYFTKTYKSIMGQLPSEVTKSIPTK